MKKTILVTGGAGYIGSHMVRLLVKEGYAPVVFDNLSTGHKNLIPSQVPFIKGDVRKASDLARVFSRYRISAVIHFAGLIAVGESVQQPLKYYENNVLGSLTLIEEVLRNRVKAFIFSSTAAVYAASRSKLKENAPLIPQSPYGWNKLLIEQALRDCSTAYGLKVVCLRYFNACGADAAGETGECHDPETHLIPNVLKAIKTGRPITIFGNDYPSKDGTCIRDYIHVEDLCLGHLAALKALSKGASSGVYNLGSGRGCTVMEVVRAAQKVTGQNVPYKMGKRRSGDAVALVSDPSKALKELRWKTTRSLEDAVRSAWQWECRQ